MSSTKQNPLPIVGIGVMIFKERKILLGKRKGAHGEGEYGSPGGKLDFGESFEECAKREAMEEAGIQIKNVRFKFVTHLKSYPGKHHVHIQLLADWAKGEPKVMEPEKCESWEWYALDKLPDNLFDPIKTTISRLDSPENYYDF